MKKTKYKLTNQLLSKGINFFLFSFFFFLSCSSNEEIEDLTDPDTSSVVSIITEQENIQDFDTTNEKKELEEIEYSYQTIFNEQQGWGYQILNYGKIYINQPHIPAISGNKGFSTEEKASKTAEYAISKIKNGMIPPTLSKEELEKLGVLE